MTRRRRALAGRRIAVGLTQEQLADALEMDVSAIKRWELGQAMPHPNVRRQLADILEVSLSELAAVLVEPSNDLGITALSSGHETRISEYKQCLRAASGDIIISGTSLVHLTDDSRELLLEKLERWAVRLLVLDPEWIAAHSELLTFLPTKRAQGRFRHEIDASLDRLSSVQASLPRAERGRLQVRAYATIFPYILTGFITKPANQSQLVVEITDYIASAERPRFTLTPAGQPSGLFEIVVAKFEELWRSPLSRRVL